MTRPAFLAGSWYPADAAGCRREVDRVLAAAELPDDLPETVCGGLVPHAGWMFSGATAATTLKSVAACKPLKRVVIFGTDHGRLRGGGAVYPSDSWSTPLGDVPIDEALAEAILVACPELSGDPGAQDGENSIEIQIPLLKALAEDVTIVPISMSLSRAAPGIGQAVGQLVAKQFPDTVIIGSTDLTHYGPNYGFTPAGGGQAGLDWTRENDRRMLDLIENMDADGVIEEAAANHNACGGGAVAAAIAACAALGATGARTLAYTTSAEVAGGPNAVGYTSVVFE